MEWLFLLLFFALLLGLLGQQNSIDRLSLLLFDLSTKMKRLEILLKEQQS